MKFIHDIIEVNEDFDEIVELISEACLSENVLLHILEDHQFRLVSAIESSDNLNSGLSSMLQQVMDEGELQSVINGDGNQSHYLGIPIRSNNQKVVGILSFLGQNKLTFNSIQKKTIRVFSKSILFLIEKDLMYRNKRDCSNQMLEINNAFYIKVGFDYRIRDVGPNFKISMPSLQVGKIITDIVSFEQNFDIKEEFDNEKSNNQIYFFTDEKDKQRYKFSFLIFENEMIISASPVINAKYTLRNYNLVLNDFSKHDYIAEYMFLQQTSAKSLNEARVISENLVKKNIELNKAQKEIGELSKFPSENPNPILRFNSKFELVYNNLASENNFITDFGIQRGRLNDKELQSLLKSMILKNEPETIILSRKKRYYSLTLVHVMEFDYINIYASDITDFISKVREKEDTLIRLNDEMERQKEFYEFILNNLPADVAVFDKNHKYVFINPKGIKDEKLRKYMIGKDDFDYAKLKNIPNTKAKKRREVFNSILKTKEFISWTDNFISKTGEREVIHRSLGPLFDENGEVTYLIGYGTDITKRVTAEEANKRLSLVAKNTNNGVVMLDIKRKITWANDAFLKRSGYSLQEVIGKSSDYFTYPEKTKYAVNSVKKAFDKEEKISVEIMRQSKSGQDYWVDLNAQPLRNEEGEVSGYMLVEFDITERRQNEEIINNLNINLEHLVQEKTTKNIELSNSLRDQEKMVTIGELAAGVAHDLNTPLGAIRSGADNIKYTLTKLFNESFFKCSLADMNFVLEYSENKKLDLYMGGLQFRKETLAFVNFLENHHLINKNQKQNLNNTAMLFVKNRISTSEKEAIDYILKANNTDTLLMFLYDFQIIFSFIDTIQSSGEKASLVIQDLRSFIKEKKNTKMGMVNLNNNIQTVLNIFNHNIKNIIDLRFDVDKNINVMGFDVRLFQLWSNLIKNSIECLEDMPGLKKMHVYSKNFSKTVSIIVENNGPIIPDDQIDKIFQKFYTTKGKRNGSGLGLSIVKNVLEEHNAKISVKSTSEKTQFKITFKKEK